ncbi:MAG: ATP-dependent sacrificial sulfur transferase LarE [Candidatus Hydrothermarchaeota archaeon]
MSKLERLEELLRGKDGIVLGFSGGLDSTFLALYLKGLGKRFVAVTVDHGMLPDLEETKALASRLGIPHQVVRVEVLQDKTFMENTPERCYFCKKEIIGALRRFQAENGYEHVLDATNLSDLSDYMAGVIALQEEGIFMPLFEAEATKADIIEFSRAMGLEAKPPESCLATRIPAYTWIRKEAIERLGRVEQGIKGLGFSLVRARAHDSLLRLQFLEAEMARALEARERIYEITRGEGFEFAAIDLAAYAGD